jgi:selenide,water dikinase
MLSHMQTNQYIPAVRDLVLVGGGHSHVQVLKSFGMRPEPGVRVTLVCRDLQTPYSGMLPGCVSGSYDEADIHIQLGPLCRFANVRLIQAEVVGLDLDNNRLQFEGRPDLRFDLLSINSGAVPRPPHPDAVTVKPISRFLPKWRALRDAIRADQSLAVVGAGAGGVELALAARAVLPTGVEITLIGEQLLPGHGRGAIARIRKELHRFDIRWIQARAVAERGGLLTLDDGVELASDYVLWVTDVAAPDWTVAAKLATDERGFISVDQHLQSLTHPRVFAAGDIAHLETQDRPKSGVYAVRAGPYLAENLRRAIQGRPLRRFRAQSRHLALIGNGHGEAIASRASWSAQGRFWWWVKDRIDQKFMSKFNDLPDMNEELPELPAALRADLPEQLMRCGGCGAKLAADPLRRVLARLPEQASAQLTLGIGDDAAMLTNESSATVLTIDGFRAMLDDPYLFGRISAHHSMNDIFAMAARPTAGLAFVTLPLMAEALMEEELYQLLRGVTDVLNAHEVPLVGGHSAEGAELGLALTITGTPGPQTLHKAGGAVGDHLILSKPIGTGVILAAAMQGRALSASVDAVQTSMDLSNADALRTLQCHGASALTDVTGFGLAGHLGEMLRAANLGVALEIDQVPLFPGVEGMFDDVQSSLQQANELALQDFELRNGHSFGDAKIRALADPQTSGGLLAAIPSERAVSCVQALRDAGYLAADIGQLQDNTWVIA